MLGERCSEEVDAARCSGSWPSVSNAESVAKDASLPRSEAVEKEDRGRGAGARAEMP